MFKFKMLTKVLVAVCFFGQIIEINLNQCIALSIGLASPEHRVELDKAWQSGNESANEHLIQTNQDGPQHMVAVSFASQPASTTTTITTTTTNTTNSSTPDRKTGMHLQQEMKVADPGHLVGHSNASEHRRPLVQTLESNGRLNYFGQIFVGQKQIPFMVLFDLASKSFWLPSSECKSDLCISRQKYAGNESTSHQADGRKIELTYDNGLRVTGHTSKDLVTFAGITLTEQPFVEVTQLEGDDLLARMSVDGLMGLGFKCELNTNESDANQPLTPFERLWKSGQLREPIFSLQLRAQVDEYKYSPDNGELLLGELSSEYQASELTYVPVTHVDYWEFHLSSVTLRQTYGAQEMERACESACPAILDTRYAFIAGHFTDVDRLNKAIGGYREGDTGLYRLSQCDLSLLPYLVFTIGGTDFALAPEEYVNVGRVRGSIRACYSALVVAQSDQYPFWILGEYFLKRHYVVFDYGQRRLGFARSKHMAHEYEEDIYGRIKRKLRPV